MENNEPPQPPPPPPLPPVPPQLELPVSPLLIYRYNPPYDPITPYLDTIFPLIITLYNFNINNTHLEFTFTSNSITITPFHVAQNHNNVADHDDGDDNNNVAEGIDILNYGNNEENNNNNNGEGENHDLVPNEIVADNDNGGGDVINGVEDHDLVPNGIVADNDDGGSNDDNNRAEFFNLHENYHDEDDNNHAGLGLVVYPEMNGVRQYGISLPTLLTLPAYINFANHNLVFLIDSGPSVHLVKPAPPLPINPIDDAENNNNNQAISHSFTIPFDIVFPFNDPNTNTIINIMILIRVNYMHVSASTQKGVTDFVAYFAMIAPQP